MTKHIIKGISLFYGTNNCWFPLARKWPTWKWTWIWIPYGKIEKKCPRYFRRDSRGNPRDLNMCRTGRSAALSRGRKSIPPRRESMKLVVQQRKSPVTWMRRHYDFTVISRWSTFSSTINLCNINLFSVTRTVPSGPPILWHSPFHAGVSVLVNSWWRWSVKICRYRRLYLCLPFNNLSKLVRKSSSQKAVKIVQRAVYSKKFASCCLPQSVAGFTKGFRVLFKFERKCQ